MRKALRILIILVLVFSLLNISVSTRQGINYRVQTVKIPLYLKLLDFFDRHYNYGPLVRKITQGAKNEEEKALRLLEWTYQNIRKVPTGFPVVDDHVWNIIIRGYGASDQSADVFSTLCNYAGVEAFYTLVTPSGGEGIIPLSLVKLRDRWVVFDSYCGVYFKDKNGNFAEVEVLKGNNWEIEQIDKNREEPVVNYASYFPNLPAPKNIGLWRANIQSPLKRLLFEIKRVGHFRNHNTKN